MIIISEQLIIFICGISIIYCLTKLDLKYNDVYINLIKLDLKYNGVFMNERYDIYKKVTLIEITDAFIDYVTNVDLTRSEYLLIQNVYKNVINKLNSDGGND